MLSINQNYLGRLWNLILNNNAIIKYSLILLNIILFIRILTYSWVTDDAFITFRSVINFVNGYGPVYNVGERVQSFTHPLWFMFLSIGGFLDINLYFWSIFLGLTFSIALMMVFFNIYKKTSNVFNYSIILIAMIFSESFLSFQTSGLENSATNFLIIFLFYIYIFIDLNKKRFFILFYFIASLILVNRFDNIFLIILPMIHVFISNKFELINKIKLSFFSLMPLILWTLFSVIYYGFFFPNPKYVKIGGRTLFESFHQGLRYSIEFIQSEFHIIILLVIVISVLILKLNKEFKYKIILFSVFMQILYILYIGGDFMRGRFFVSIVVVTLFLFLNIDIFKNTTVLRKIFFLLIFMVISYSVYYYAFNENLFIKFPGMENERNMFKEYLGLNLNPYLNYNNHRWAIDGQKINKDNSGKIVTIIGVNGMRGYYSNSNIILIDPIGLTDAFISRLPVIDNKRTGHFKRDIPEEYYRERLNNIQIENWNNSNYKILNNHIKNITRSKNIFSIDRFKSMLWVWRNYGV